MVESVLLVRWVVGSSVHGEPIIALSCFLFQPVLHRSYNKGHDMLSVSEILKDWSE